ncbi:YqiA/YcfP family alpha/beta fold hydrolase [Leptothrix ochracea]|uniref:YqiA/YcfP family alpha/beta fold hydrolase n=1 Tax=Leptothrix ochracea TaxID=735331 RepID=UPI0034E21963
MNPPALTHLLYLHGFRSSPQSMKARKVAEWVARERPDLHFWCPQLPPSPLEAIALLRAGVADWPAGQSAVIGSSLGGFYAAVLLDTLGSLGWRAVLINPAVQPARDLARYIGEQRSWHDPLDRFFFRAEFIDELRAMAPGTPQTPRTPKQLLAVIAQGDEVLDAHEMRAAYAACPMLWLPGGDHALSDFDQHWPAMMRFLTHGEEPCA